MTDSAYFSLFVSVHKLVYTCMLACFSAEKCRLQHVRAEQVVDLQALSRGVHKESLESRLAHAAEFVAVLCTIKIVG